MKIDPERLSRLRKKNGLSRPQLAKRSGINERTIQRLESKSESQQHQKTHEHTVNRLAKALNVKPGVLTGELPFRESGKEPAYDSERVQIGTQIMPKVRLAYDLIKRRYGVSPAEIINMAPLFFALLAEGSLAWRREKLKEVGEAIDRLESIDGVWSFGFDNAATVVAYDGFSIEENSIDKADLFGEHLFDTSYSLIDVSFNPYEDNPFASYLRKLKAELDIAGIVDVDSGELMFGVPLKFPDYYICSDELDGIINGSDHAKMALATGDVRLSEIPEELMAEDASEKRTQWLEDKLSDTLKKDEGELKNLIRRLTETPKGDPEVEEVIEKLVKIVVYQRVRTCGGILDPEGNLRNLLDPEGNLRNLIRRLTETPKGDPEVEEVIEKLVKIVVYQRVRTRSGILDPEGNLRKLIEESAISTGELDRLLDRLLALEETDSQATNSDIEKGEDDQ